MVPSSVFLEQAGWFLIHSFFMGLVALPVLWLWQRAVTGLRTPVRSACAMVAFLGAVILPLAGAWLMVEPASAPVAAIPTGSPLEELGVETISQNDRLVTYIDPVDKSAINDVGSVATTPVSLNDEPAGDDAVVVKSPTTLVRTLPWAWLLGASLTALLLVLGLAGSFRLRRQTMQLPMHLQESIDRTLAMVPGVSVGVRISELVQSPILVGIIRPLVLLPATAVGWTPETLQFVVLHELAHVKRWDNLANLIQRIFEVVCFYQPAVWVASAWVRSEREMSCDEFVAAMTNEPTRYAETLVRLATSVSHRTTNDLVTCSSTQHALVARVARLVGKEETMRLRLRTIVCVCGLVFGSLTLVTVTSVAAPQQESQDAEKATDNKAVDVHEILADTGHAPDPIRLVKDRTEIRLTAPASIIIEANWIQSVEGHDEDVLSIAPLTPHQVLLTTRKAGEADFTVITADDYRYLVHVDIMEAPPIFNARPQLKFLNQTVVSAQVGGIMMGERVRLGAQVKRGEKLGVVKNADLEAEVGSLRLETGSEVNLKYAKASLQVAEQKFAEANAKSDSYSAAELTNLELELRKAQLKVEQVEFQREIARIQLASSNERLNTCTIRAPHDGRVTDLLVRPGEVLQPGQAAFEVSDLGQLRAVFRVPAASADGLRVGQCVRFVPKHSKSPTLFGRITFRSSDLNPVTQEIECHAVLDNPHERIRSGQAGSLLVLDAQVSNRSKQAARRSASVTVKKGRAAFFDAARVFLKVGKIEDRAVSISVVSKEAFVDGAADTPPIVPQTDIKLGGSMRFETNGESFRLRLVAVIERGNGLEAIFDASKSPSPQSSRKISLKHLEPTAFIHVVGVLFRNEPHVPEVKSVEPDSVEIVATKSQFAEIEALLRKLGETPDLESK